MDNWKPAIVDEATNIKELLLALSCRAGNKVASEPTQQIKISCNFIALTIDSLFFFFSSHVHFSSLAAAPTITYGNLDNIVVKRTNYR